MKLMADKLLNVGTRYLRVGRLKCSRAVIVAKWVRNEVEIEKGGRLGNSAIAVPVCVPHVLLLSVRLGLSAHKKKRPAKALDSWIRGIWQLFDLAVLENPFSLLDVV
jgi:hypothetical protein